MAAKKSQKVPGKKTVLHIEGGKPNPATLHRMFATPEWQVARLDPDPKLKPDYLGRLTDFSAVPDASMDAVWCRHNLQQLFFHQVREVLPALSRILKEEGILMLALPDLQQIAEVISEGKLESQIVGNAAPLDMLFGSRDMHKALGDSALNRTGFTAVTLSNALHDAGYKNLQIRREGFVLWAAAQKLPKTHPAYNLAPNIIDYNRAIKTSRLPDELDAQPQRWQPLGLKKA